MTHDELLAKINAWDEGYYQAPPVVRALRAVVELHTGFSTGECADPECCSNGPDYLCSECQEDYPCRTIQAIEKELG